jgi:hypothetical protein
MSMNKTILILVLVSAACITGLKLILNNNHNNRNRCVNREYREHIISYSKNTIKQCNYFVFENNNNNNDSINMVDTITETLKNVFEKLKKYKEISQYITVYENIYGYDNLQNSHKEFANKTKYLQYAELACIEYDIIIYSMDYLNRLCNKE